MSRRARRPLLSTGRFASRSSTISGLSSLIVPIVGVLAAWLQLDEQPSLAEAGGIVLILTGLGMLIFSGRSGRAASAPARGDGTETRNGGYVP